MIKAMFIASSYGHQQQALNQITVEQNKGIVGDRYFDQHLQDNITLIEFENIEAINRTYQQDYALHDSRRNIVTQGIELNHLVGKIFKLGNVTLIGTELCEPCKTLGQKLANDTITPKQVIQAFTSKGGLRAQILTDGKLEIGMPFSE